MPRRIHPIGYKPPRIHEPMLDVLSDIPRPAERLRRLRRALPATREQLVQRFAHMYGVEEADYMRLFRDLRKLHASQNGEGEWDLPRQSSSSTPTSIPESAPPARMTRGRSVPTPMDATG